jgi:alpha-N-arabinofuranosidase
MSAHRAGTNAFINFDHRTWFPAPNYVVMKLWRDHFATSRLATTGDTNLVNAVTTRSDDGQQVFLKLVNPSDRVMEIQLAVEDGFIPAEATLKIVAPDDLKARHTLDARDTVRVVESKVQMEGANAGALLPRWSAGVVELKSQMGVRG